MGEFFEICIHLLIINYQLKTLEMREAFLRSYSGMGIGRLIWYLVMAEGVYMCCLRRGYAALKRRGLRTFSEWRMILESALEKQAILSDVWCW